ncbi:MAG: XRE family transcriptional regulator [bacterium]
MIYRDFKKTIKKLMIETEIGTKEIAEKLGESQQNIIGKINRETIRLMDAEKILDALGYKLTIKDK